MPGIDAGLDLLWVSIDGASPESYADVRLGAELPNILDNLQRFRTLRKGHKRAKPEIGIAFVAMKRNIGDLPKVLKIARQLGALHFSVSNVLPITDALQGEVLYTDYVAERVRTLCPTTARLRSPATSGASPRWGRRCGRRPSGTPAGPRRRTTP